MPRTTSAGKRKIGTKLIPFLILLVPQPTNTVLVLVLDLVRPSKQFIFYVPRKAAGVTDHRGVQAMSTSLKALFPGSEQDPCVLHPCRYCRYSAVPENAKTDVTKGDLSTAESQPHTSYLQECRT